MKGIFLRHLFLYLAPILFVIGCSSYGNPNGDGGDIGDGGDNGDSGDSSEGDDGGECEFKWAPDAQSGAFVIEIEDRDVFNAHVIREGCGMTMWADAVKTNDAKIFRFESEDGFHWSEGAPISFSSGNTPGGRPYVIKKQDGSYIMWYHTGVDMNQPIGTRNDIGMATSFDGIEWYDEGIVYSGSGQEADDFVVENPTVWYDGEIYHLIYCGLREYLVIDVVIYPSSILHATSVDGTNFEFNTILFQSEACQGGSPTDYSQWQIQDVIRSHDTECPTRDTAYLLTRAKQCSQNYSLYLSQLSSDGSVGDVFPLAVDTFATSSMLVGRDLWLYGHQKYSTDRNGILIHRAELPDEVGLECP